MATKVVEVGTKLYLNGFPKSGTHLLDSMAIRITRPADPGNNWMGNLSGYAFNNDLIHMDTIPVGLAELPERRYVKGHVAWHPDIVEGLLENHWCMVFIYRDLRDVAVSTAFHAQGSEDWKFPEKEFYQSLEFDEVLKRIITGDETIDGVMDRWELFAPWLDEEWVLKLDYGDAVTNKEWACELFVRYLYGRTARYLGVKAEISADYFNEVMHRMMDQLAQPKTSPTYRNGKTGEWKKHFTDEHKDLFKESDKNNWLIRLGYENDRNW